jgi:hypothetical protein
METEAQGGCATEEHDAALCLVCQKNILHMNTKNKNERKEENKIRCCET